MTSSASSNSESQPTRILVVDDNRDSAESLASLLTLLGNDVRTAFDATAALEPTPQWKPDIVFLDIALPEMSGHDVARALRARITTPLLLVALTGYDRPDDRRRSLEAGFDHHVVKPIRIEVLRSLLARGKNPGAIGDGRGGSAEEV